VETNFFIEIIDLIGKTPISPCALPHEILFLKSEEISQVTHLLHEKEMRWLELSEKG
jgi:hypothetical protein